MRILIFFQNTDGIPPIGSNIHNCECTACKAVMKDTAQWTSMQKEADSDIVIKIGDRVLVHGCLPGVVRYVGDLDSDYTNDQIYIGVKLDDPGQKTESLMEFSPVLSFNMISKLLIINHYSVSFNNFLTCSWKQ